MIGNNNSRIGDLERVIMEGVPVLRNAGSSTRNQRSKAQLVQLFK